MCWFATYDYDIYTRSFAWWQPFTFCPHTLGDMAVTVWYSYLPSHAPAVFLLETVPIWMCLQGGRKRHSWLRGVHDCALLLYSNADIGSTLTPVCVAQGISFIRSVALSFIWKWITVPNWLYKWLWRKRPKYCGLYPILAPREGTLSAEKSP